MLFRCLVAVAMAVAILGSDAAPATTPGKVALVIGNAAYPEAPLRNAVNDAREVALTLRERGFEVILRADASKQPAPATSPPTTCAAADDLHPHHRSAG